MTVEELNQYFDRLADQLNEGLQKDLPDLIGTEAVNFFKEGFLNEGFTDASLEKWPDVKRRTGKNAGADALRKILTGRTGNLHDSIRYDVEPDRVIVSANPMNAGADQNYAGAHNFGTSNAGRARNTVIPQRKFLAHSQTLNKRIVERIERYLKNMMKL